MKDKKFYPWVVVGLLWVVALLNYMDRQMLSTMQEAMKMDIVELQKAEMFGVLMAVFLWIYGFMSPVAGMIADKVSRKWLIVGSLFVWSAVTYLMGYAADFNQLLVLRASMPSPPTRTTPISRSFTITCKTAIRSATAIRLRTSQNSESSTKR